MELLATSTSGTTVTTSSREWVHALTCCDREAADGFPKRPIGPCQCHVCRRWHGDDSETFFTFAMVMSYAMPNRKCFPGIWVKIIQIPRPWKRHVELRSLKHPLNKLGSTLFGQVLVTGGHALCGWNCLSCSRSRKPERTKIRWGSGLIDYWAPERLEDAFLGYAEYVQLSKTILCTVDLMCHLSSFELVHFFHQHLKNWKGFRS